MFILFRIRRESREKDKIFSLLPLLRWPPAPSPKPRQVNSKLLFAVWEGKRGVLETQVLSIFFSRVLVAQVKPAQLFCNIDGCKIRYTIEMPPRHVCVLVLAALLPAVAVDSGDVDVEVPSSSELLPTECEDEDLDCREWAEKGYCLGM